MDLPRGSFHFLTGPSGAGKTTLLKLASLELRPLHGRIAVLDQPTENFTRENIADTRRRIGIVQQETQFIDHLNIFENVLLPVTASGSNSSTDRANVRELLEWVGLGDRLDDNPQELSGGEKQRVALARALVLAPEIIIADEPTGNVDWEMAQNLMGLLYQLNGLGRTVLIATHDLQLIRQSRNHIQAHLLRLDRGKITTAGSAL